MEVLENAAFEIDGVDLAFLRRKLRGNIEPRGEGWAITRLVGHIALPSGRTLRIRSPKAPGASIIAWMAFVDPALGDLRSMGPVPQAIDSGDVAALVARLFFSELFQAFSRHGLGRKYLNTHMTGATVRGRIDFNALARRGGELSRLPCRFWERLPDTPLNRLLVTAVDAIGRDPALRQAFATDVGRGQAILAGVRARSRRDILAENAPLDRTELPFQGARAFARILLHGTLVGEGTSEPGLGFIVNLDTLFEKTVARAVAMSGLRGLAKEPVPYTRIRHDGTRRRGAMEMDVFIPASHAHGAVVLDAKYKSSVSSANLQQVLAYCSLTGARLGVLVTPAGLSTPPSRYEFRSRDASANLVEVHVLEITTGSTTVEQWRQACLQLATRIQQAVHS